MHTPPTHVAPPPPQSASVQHAAPQLHTAPFFTYGAVHVKSQIPPGVQIDVPLTGLGQGTQLTDVVQPVSGVLPRHCPLQRWLGALHMGPLALEDTALDEALEELFAPLPLDAAELALDELAEAPEPLALLALALPLVFAGPSPEAPPIPLAPPPKPPPPVSITDEPLAQLTTRTPASAASHKLKPV